MKLYLDTCCYSRPYDDQVQEKIHMESEAVLVIINRSRQNKDKIVGSLALDFEIEQISDIEKREKLKYFYEQTIINKFEYTDDVYNRVKELSENTNLKTLDRFHLSFTENYDVDILLTTDDRFEKACAKISSKVRVINPLKYLMEVMQNEYNA
jgi:predicted nucleic acid-binding protein